MVDLDIVRPIPWRSALPLAPAFETLCLCSPCCDAFVSTAPVMPRVSRHIGCKRHSQAVLDVGSPAICVTVTGIVIEIDGRERSRGLLQVKQDA